MDDFAQWKRERTTLLDWSALGRVLDGMRDRILKDSFRPQAVIGIARGGLVPAIYFANALKAADFHILGMLRNASDEPFSAKRSPTLCWESPMPDLSGKSLLVVDDIVGDGETMALAIATVRDRDAAEIRTAAVARYQGSRFTPDYCGITADGWIVFPWEASSDGEV